jgi:uracil-DNA glycosylase
VEELMAERGLSMDHTTIWRWTQTYAPEVQRRLRGQVKRKGSTWPFGRFKPAKVLIVGLAPADVKQYSFFDRN